MRLICFWCAILAAVSAQLDDGFYAPQTFRQHIDSYHKSLFTPAAVTETGNDVTPQGTIVEGWRPGPRPLLQPEPWRGSGPSPLSSGPVLAREEPWRSPYPTKEQQAAILHHKQALTSDGSFRFEYASDNGLAAGEVIEPDGSRVGAYQYKDQNGQLVKLKYRAGKDGFQILEGSHLPKSPEPVPPTSQDHQQAYEQQRQAFELQQQYNQQPQQRWSQRQEIESNQQRAAGNQHLNWRPATDQEDDGQYRENEVENRGPHTFGEGFSFAFQG